MAYEIPVLNISLVAGMDFSSFQYRAVKINENGKIILAGEGEKAIGILQDKPALGQAGAVMVYGVSPVVYGDSIEAGQVVAVGENGTVVPCQSGAIPLGVALESGQASEIHPILLK